MRAFRVTVPEVDEDAATTALWEAGTAGIEVRPAGDLGVQLIAYFPASTPAQALGALPPSATVEATEVPSVDWVARFREGFRPLRAGRFHVVPVWGVERHRAVGCDCLGPAATLAPATSGSASAPSDVLIVDPGRAFGTGTHETTRLCLSAIEDLAARRQLGRTLDLGAGSGILAIAAVRLGAAPAVASDLDPEAVDSARLHAALNRTPLLGVRADGGRGFRPRSFDLVLANLMALLLVDRAPEVRALLAPDAALVLSGLLLDDVPGVRAAFASCGTPLEQRDGEWAALVYEHVP